MDSSDKSSTEQKKAAATRGLILMAVALFVVLVLVQALLVYGLI
jgi:hypothetical protein